MKKRRLRSGFTEIMFRRAMLKNIVPIFLLLLLPSMAASGYSQPEGITLAVENVSLAEVFSAIRNQSGYTFVYHTDDVRNIKVESLDVKGATIREVMDACLRNTPYGYAIEDNVVVTFPRNVATQAARHRVTGTVRSADGEPMVGVSVVFKGSRTGTSTDRNGSFTLDVPAAEGTLVLSFIGFQTREMPFRAGTHVSVVMEEAELAVEEVVVTGIYSRERESFTGSAASYTAQELKMVGSQNVLQSLKTLDPALTIIENNDWGSDPNRLPDVEIRGKTSVIGLREQYSTDPNQPLFILDGFETTLKAVVDLNMDRVASVTILKDAASTAIYGSKAANGVVVIETKRPEAGEFRVTYSGNYSLSIPDLSDYNLMNAAEKMEFEFLSGFYTDPNNDIDYTNQLQLDKLYNEHLANLQRGVDTYWLSEPLRIALTHKHNVYAEGGDQTVRYGLGVTGAGTNGVMKQSGNSQVGINFDLDYRKGAFRFYNKLSLGYTKSHNPSVPFSAYSRANPYFEKRNPDGGIERYLESYYTVNKEHKTVENPLYNARLNSFDRENALDFVNAFNIEWRPVDYLVARGRLGLGKNMSRRENFISPAHTQFDTTVPNRRGRYTSGMGDRWYYDGDFSITYGQLLNDVHQVNAVLGSRFNSTEQTNESYEAVGFPIGDFDTPSFATFYRDGGKPSFSRSVARSASFYLNAGYSYDRRYLLDLNFRLDGTSVFGTNKRFTETWAVGLGWNIHNEAFMEDVEWIDLLKLRGSVGNPGNQNFDAYQTYTTYIFNNWLQNVFGTGMIVEEIGNPNLEWQKTIDRNVGLDVALFNNRFTLNVDYYHKNTDPLVALLGIPSSLGMDRMTTNMGSQTGKGINGTIRYSPIFRPQEATTWTVGLTFKRQKAEYRDIGNALEKFNEESRQTSMKRYYDGGSPTALWAVRSLGINPANGQEVFLKKNGKYTYTFDKRDEVVVGDSEPALEGVLSNTVYYKGFSLSVYLRYSFGGEVFNKALYSKVENITADNIRYNQDKRALHDRWTTLGQHAQFKGISLTGRTEMSSRFVKTENYIRGESISMGYDFPKEWLERSTGFSAMRLQLTMNDIFRLSSVKEERGIEYPFARMVSGSLSLTF